ncbi:MAG: hypothetical protein KTR26_22285 [Flammeovirgaceae bacterium]|nr:hypothetical protein [Flammeovirgaceae bacterium]
MIKLMMAKTRPIRQDKMLPNINKYDISSQYFDGEGSPFLISIFFAIKEPTKNTQIFPLFSL